MLGQPELEIRWLGTVEGKFGSFDSRAGERRKNGPRRRKGAEVGEDAVQRGALRPEPQLKGGPLDWTVRPHANVTALSCAGQLGVVMTFGLEGGNTTTEEVLKETTTAFLLAWETLTLTRKVFLLGETHTTALRRR